MSSSTPVSFRCVGCGDCCKGRFVPLTLSETAAWLARGDDVVVLLEAFEPDETDSPSAEYRHNVARSDRGRSGTAEVQVIAIFAASVLQGCPNLGVDNACTIYSERPLVCRIYPMEINPFISLVPTTKECPDDAWNSSVGEWLIASDGQAVAGLQQLIDASRIADREDAQAKIAICQQLGITTAAWKGNGLAVHFPEHRKLLQAIAEQPSKLATEQPWRIHAHGEDLLQYLQESGVALHSGTQDHLFIPLPG